MSINIEIRDNTKYGPTRFSDERKQTLKINQHNIEVTLRNKRGKNYL